MYADPDECMTNYGSFRALESNSDMPELWSCVARPSICFDRSLLCYLLEGNTGLTHLLPPRARDHTIESEELAHCHIISYNIA
jgi:hypothetical protein